MNPFMHTFSNPPRPCWHNSMLAANGVIYAIPRTEQDWTVPYVAFAASLTGRKYAPRVVGYDLFAHPDSWAMAGAFNLARAYLPEAVRR